MLGGLGWWFEATNCHFFPLEISVAGPKALGPNPPNPPFGMRKGDFFDLLIHVSCTFLISPILKRWTCHQFFKKMSAGHGCGIFQSSKTGWTLRCDYGGFGMCVLHCWWMGLLDINMCFSGPTSTDWSRFGVRVSIDFLRISLHMHQQKTSWWVPVSKLFRNWINNQKVDSWRELDKHPPQRFMFFPISLSC